MDPSNSETLQFLSPELGHDNLSLGLQQAYEIAKSRTSHKDVSNVNFFAGKMEHLFGVFKSAALDLSVMAINNGPALGMLRGHLENNKPKYYSADEVKKVEENLKNGGFQVERDTKHEGQNLFVTNSDVKVMFAFGYPDQQSAKKAYGGKDVPGGTDETKQITVISYPEPSSLATHIYSKEGIPNSRNTEILLSLVNPTLDTMTKVMKIVNDVVEPQNDEALMKPKIVNWVGATINGTSTLADGRAVVNNNHVVGTVLD